MLNFMMVELHLCQQVQLPSIMLHLVLEQAQFTLTILSAVAVRIVSLIVHVALLSDVTLGIQKMLE